MPRSDLPAWWAWELELSPHLLKRMLDRGFTEVELRSMLESPVQVRKGAVAGRWIVEARLKKRSWEVVVEPDEEAELLVVITAYSLM
jgi:hypothetical protein